MTSVIEAKNGMRELSAKAKAVLADTSITPAEQMTKLDALQSDLKSFSDVIAVDEKAKLLISGGDSAPEAKDPERKADFKSLGHQVTDSAAYKSFIRKDSQSANIELKTNMTEGIIPAYSGGSGNAGQLLTPQFQQGIVPLKFQQLTVADLLAQGSTSNASISYVIEAAFNDTTAAVSEGAAAPVLDLTLTRRQDNVSTIANASKQTRELIEDAEAFQSYLENRMTFGLKRKEEAELLNATGPAPDLVGILGRSGLATAVVTSASLTAVKAMEGIFNQITALRSTSFVEPDAIVINPTDWQTIRLGKDAQGQYYAGGPFTGAYGNAGPSNVYNLWGFKTVVTSAIAQGTVLVGGFQECGQIFRRQGINLEMTNSDGTDFTSRIVTLLATERLALTVPRPAGFGKVTLTA
ncbi:phage major capsid protein [Arthrobacter sp. NA-172]|uniref:phage major capsid protein n=1 Tax=Arthrobacter sp. NA-172 TaxID=3367524 RepID=UPI0037541D67